MKIVLVIVLLAKTIQCYPNVNNFTHNEEVGMPEICDDQDIDWDKIQYRATEKLSQITNFMKRKDVRMSVQREMKENLNRVKRDGYDDDHDDNVVVRCKHGYTGGSSHTKNFFDLCFMFHF